MNERTYNQPQILSLKIPLIETSGLTTSDAHVKTQLFLRFFAPTHFFGCVFIVPGSLGGSWTFRVVVISVGLLRQAVFEGTRFRGHWDRLNTFAFSVSSLLDALRGAENPESDMAPSVMGVYRNRTKKFLELRQETRRNRTTISAAGVGTSDQTGLLGSGEVELEVMEQKAPHWVEIVDAIHRGLDMIQHKSTSWLCFSF
jgi:hypothetical protein